MKQGLTAFRWWMYPLTGVLLYAAWPMSPLTALIFVAWVPLLMAEKQLTNGAWYFFVCWLNMTLWNAGTTWWIWNSTGPGAVGAILANSLLMCFPIMAFRFTRRALGDAIGYTSLIAYWITFEYIHHNWDLSWPWLTLGNVFSTHPDWVQWYEYTGTTGGTLWILLMNILLFQMLSNAWTPRLVRYHTAFLALLLSPILVSFLLSVKTSKMPPSTTNVVVVQPNVEPYTEKFTTDPAILIADLIRLSESQIDSGTRLVAWPETAIPSQAWENKLLQNDQFQPVFAFLKRHPQIMLVTGIDSYKYWGAENPGTFSIRQMSDGSYYEAFNTALGADASMNLQLYHKAKLVPGVETLPSWLGFMGKLFDDFGGISGSLGRSDSAMVLSAANNPYKAAPIICYESIYSNYVTEYVRSGANILTVITNDGWWGETPGYKQHMSMSRLRAIETRKWVARSANTGISCFISPSGEVWDAQPWRVKAAIKMPIPVNNKQTFYVQFGDWMSRLLWPLAMLILLFAASKRIFNRKLRF